MPSLPTIDVVVKRRNSTLKNMVRIMIFHYTLLESLYGEALKTAVYILNRILIKPITKTPYKIWISKKTSLKNFHAKGFPAKARYYRPNENQLDSRMVSYYFTGCSERSRGYKFYNPMIKSNFKLENT